MTLPRTFRQRRSARLAVAASLLTLLIAVGGLLAQNTPMLSAALLLLAAVGALLSGSLFSDALYDGGRSSE